MHFYVFFAMLAGRWSKGEGLGERVDPLRPVLDTFDQRVDGFWGPQGRLGTSFWRLFGCLGPHFGGPGGCWEYTAILLPWLAGWGVSQNLGNEQIAGKNVSLGLGGVARSDH